MVKIKGTAVGETIRSVKASQGEQTYDTILGMLKPETRILFDQAAIMPSNWYPLDALLEFLEVNLRLTAGGNERELIKRAEATIERQLKGIYKLFVKLGSPEFVLKRLSIVHQTYFQGVDIDVNICGGGKAIVKYTGFERQHRLVAMLIIGYFRKALQISGASNVSASFITPIEAGKGFCELALSWSE
jgi:hypothetical protein